MAIAHMTVKVGKVGKSAPHAKYIDGIENNRNDIEKTKSGNMPEWAKNNTLKFWESADLYERSNGSTYREYEIALPRELTLDQREKLVDDFIENEIGNKYPYQYAIHNPKAIDGEDQPHAHIMFSERKMDGVARDPEQHFKRYNAKYPERGGAQKENFAKSGTQRITELKELRNRWENTVNKHLELAGQTARIDMRSYKDQGLERQPERKYLPSEWHNKDKRADLIEFREARAELEATRIPTAEIQAYLILENEKIKLDSEKPKPSAPPLATPVQLQPVQKAHLQAIELAINTMIKKAEKIENMEKEIYTKLTEYLKNTPIKSGEPIEARQYVAKQVIAHIDKERENRIKKQTSSREPER